MVFGQIFPDNSQIFTEIPNISLTSVKFPHISSFSTQQVSLLLHKTMVKHIITCISVDTINHLCTINSSNCTHCI